MRRYPIGLMAGSMMFALCALVLLGCGGEKEDEDDDSGGARQKGRRGGGGARGEKPPPPHALFLPHCSVLFPSHYADGKQVPTGQKFLILNDALVTHNSKVIGGPINGSRNITIPPKGGPLEVQLKPEKT